MTTVDSRVAIVGAGVFGLSTALHLKRRGALSRRALFERIVSCLNRNSGYHDVTVFDYQPYNTNAYDPNDECDAASANVNKIS